MRLFRLQGEQDALEQAGGRGEHGAAGGGEGGEGGRHDRKQEGVQTGPNVDANK